MEIKIHTCLLQILCFCGWTQLFNFILGSCCSLPSTAHSTATFCPTNNLMHSLLTTTSSHDVSHKLLSHCTNTILSLFTSHCKRMFSNIVIFVCINFSCGIMSKWILLLVFLLLSLILCVQDV